MTEVVYDYRTGDIIDASSGLVIDRIFEATGVDGFERSLRADSVIDRLHYERYGKLTFKARDPVAAQIAELKLTPTWKKTYTYLLRSFLRKLDERRLLEIYRFVRNYLEKHRALTREDIELIKKIVRDLAPELRIRRIRVEMAIAAAIYVARLLLGIVGIDLYRLREELGLSLKDIEKVLELVRKLSIKYKCIDRYGIIAREIERICDELGIHDVELVAKLLLASPRLRIDGLSSRYVAASLVYIAALLKGYDSVVTQERIANAARVSDGALRTRYKSFAKMLGIEIVRRYNGYGAVEYIDVPAELCKVFKMHGLKLASYVYCYF